MDKAKEQEELKKLYEYSDAFNTGYNLEKLQNDPAVEKKDKVLLRTVSEKFKEAKSSNEQIQAFKDGRKQYKIDREREKLKEQARKRDERAKEGHDRS